MAGSHQWTGGDAGSPYESEPTAQIPPESGYHPSPQWSPDSAPQGYGMSGGPSSGYPGQGYHDYGMQSYGVAPGTGPAKVREPNRLLMFARRDQTYFLLGMGIIAAGIVALIAPFLTFFSSRDSDLGKMTISGTGSIGMSKAVEKTLSDDDVMEHRVVEAVAQALMDPVNSLWLLSAVLVILGGLFVLLTARSFGGYLVLAATVPVVVFLIGALLTLPDDFLDSDSGGGGTSFGAGFWLLISSHVIALGLAIAALARTRRVS